MDLKKKKIFTSISPINRKTRWFFSQKVFFLKQMAGKYNLKPNSCNFKIILKTPEHNSPKSESACWLDLLCLLM